MRQRDNSGRFTKGAPAPDGINIQNSMTQLVQSAFAQTNLTSFLPALTNNIYAPLSINWTLLMYMYKTHGIIQTAIEVPVLDALRGGLVLKSDELGADELKDLEDALEKLGILDTVGTAKVWARLFGGGALVINTEADPMTPLGDDEFAPGKKVEFYAANRWEVSSPHRIAEFYNFYGRNIHHSRVLTMIGKEAPYILRWQLAGWGMSEIERMLEPFNQYIRTVNVIYELLEEAKIDVYKLENFNAQLASSAGTQLTERRVQLMNQLKNFNRAIVMDMKDDFAQKQLTFSGLAEMMKEARIGIASALRMPMTKLFGLSASGMNAGEEDIENYNAMIESEVRQPLRPVIRKILLLMSRAMFGQEFDIAFEFKPLRILSAEQEENVKTQKHNRYTQLYDRGIIDARELAEMSQKDNLVSMEIQAAKGNGDPFPAAPGTEGDGMDDGEGEDEKKDKGESNGKGKDRDRV